jgi:hypothetical protein
MNWRLSEIPEAIFCHLENPHVLGARWRDHFWALGRITGDTGNAGRSEVNDWVISRRQPESGPSAAARRLRPRR